MIHGAERKRGAPREALGLDVECADANFGAHGAQIAEVGVFIILSAHSRREDAVNEIVAVASVKIHGGAHAIVPQTQFQAEIPLVHLLPGEIAVLEMADVYLVFSVAEAVSLHNAALVDRRSVDGFLIHLGGEPIAEAYGEFRDVAKRTHEGFAVDVPFCTEIPGGQPQRAGFASCGVGTFVVEHGVHDVTPRKSVGAVERKREPAVVALTQSEVVVVLFGEFAENERAGVDLIAAIILYAVAGEGRVGAVCGAQLGESEGFEVVFAATEVVVGGQTREPTAERSLVVVEQSALGNANLGLLVGMILVVYQIDVLFGHKRGLVGTKGLDEIAVLGDFVRRGGVRTPSGHKSFERQAFAQLIGGFALQFEVDYLEIQGVVGILVEDIEGRPVVAVEGKSAVCVVRRERAARSQGIRERIDVEIALEYALRVVFALRQGAGCGL